MAARPTTLHRSIVLRPVASLKPYAGNARTHSKKQLKQIAASIERFGFTNPVLIGDDDQIIAGHGRVAAARMLGLEQVPTLTLAHLSPAERRAYVLADNKIAANAGWDRDLLAIELQGLIDMEFDLELTGFELAEIDLILDEAADADPVVEPGSEDVVPALEPQAVSQRGDVWLVGRHRLLCGDARDKEDYRRLLDDEQVDMLFTDPPYNVPSAGHVSGLGKVRHREFVFTSGEMSQEAFTAFLADTLGHAAAACRDGAIAFVCMDWRHIGELLAAGGSVFTELKNLVVWNKSNGGMGSFYRSKHELIFVYRTACQQLRTWRQRALSHQCLGLSGHQQPERDDELAMHPTVKPVALIADAIRDCSKRGQVILDPFGGSGSTLIAADKVGRNARLIEYDPLYCDTIVRCWQTFTGKAAYHADEQRCFDEIAEQRTAATIVEETGQ